MVPNFLFKRKRGDSNPRYSYPYDSLANCWFQPLTHPSFRLTEILIFQMRVQRYYIFGTYANFFALFFVYVAKKL